MSEIFHVDFESGVLLDPGAAGHGFDIVAAHGGGMAIKTTAKYSGTWGLEATPYYVSGTYGYINGGCKSIHNPSSGKLRQAFYFHPHTLTMETSHYINLAANFHYDNSRMMYAVQLGFDGANFTIRSALADNSFALNTYSGTDTLSVAWHLIEYYWQKGAPGSFQMWLDGVNLGTITDTNNLCYVNKPGIGCNMRILSPVVTTGSVWFDRWRANDDGSVIGS